MEAGRSTPGGLVGFGSVGLTPGAEEGNDTPHPTAVSTNPPNC